MDPPLSLHHRRHEERNALHFVVTRHHSHSACYRLSKRRQGVTRDLAPRIQLGDLSFPVSDWRALTGTRHAFADDLHGWLLCSEWEALTQLEVTFGSVCDRSIMVELNGIGLHESWPELLGSEVPFSVGASLLFTGVLLRTPPNVTDPTAHALSRLRHFLPDYRFELPRVEELRHDGRLWGCDVLFPPASVA